MRLTLDPSPFHRTRVEPRLQQPARCLPRILNLRASWLTAIAGIQAMVAVVAVVALACFAGAGTATAYAQTPDSPGPRQWQTPPAGSAERGLALYTAQCTACHAVDTNQTGPAHRGVMGRRVGGLAGYRYSEELAQSRLRWTPQTLNAWLEDPESLVAGQRMGFQVPELQDRADLIAYLATLKQR